MHMYMYACTHVQEEQIMRPSTMTRLQVSYFHKFPGLEYMIFCLAIPLILGLQSSPDLPDVWKTAKNRGNKIKHPRMYICTLSSITANSLNKGHAPNGKVNALLQQAALIHMLAAQSVEAKWCLGTVCVLNFCTLLTWCNCMKLVSMNAGS